MNLRMWWQKQDMMLYPLGHGELRVSRPTVSVALKALAEEGDIFVDDTHEINLTVKERQVAEDPYERDNTFRPLLMGLGVDEKTAAADACEMEHAVSRESYEALKVLAERAKGESVG